MHESSILTFSSDASVEARKEIFSRMRTYPASDEETERSLGLFLRGSLLARFLAIDQIYRKIVGIPGIVVDLGTWRGQTAVLCENLRAIHEPLNFYRRVVCFDTFEGYSGFSARDKPTALHREGTYGVGGDGYAEYLRQLLRLHENSNAMGHNCDKHTVVEGDCRETLPRYFVDHPHEVVALAFFDLNAHDPTLKAFEAVWDRLVPGGVVAFWQLTRATVPAEGAVYAENILGKLPHKVSRSDVYPGLCFLEKA